MSGDDLVVTTGDSAIGVQQEEDRDAAKHPSRQKIVLHHKGSSVQKCQWYRSEQSCSEVKLLLPS